MALKYYYDLISQPCRAVYMFLRLNKVPYEDKPVALRKGEHQSEEYAKILPFKLVPSIEDNGFLLTESIAIVEYITNTRKTGAHWYPTDPQKRARVSEYLHWHHINTRENCANLSKSLFIIPRATGKPVNQDIAQEGRQNVNKAVQHIESYFLRDTPFLSSNVITAADLFGVCDLMQLYGVMEEGLYESSPILKAWMDRVKKETSPEFDAAHKFVYRMREVYHQGMSKLGKEGCWVESKN